MANRGGTGRQAAQNEPVDVKKTVLLGKDGWLFHQTDRVIPYIQGADSRLARRNWNAGVLLWTRERKWLAARGAHYLVVFAPEKHTVYPEFLPDSITGLSRETRLDQLMRHLRERSETPVLDLREAICEGKAQGQIYYKLDSHWNALGTYLAYAAIVDRIKDWFPSNRPFTLVSVEKTMTGKSTGDLVRSLALEGSMRENVPQVQLKTRLANKKALEEKWVEYLPGAWPGAPWVREVDDPALPKAVCFCDSFGSWLATN